MKVNNFLFWVEIFKLGVLKYRLKSKQLRIAKTFKRKRKWKKRRKRRVEGMPHLILDLIMRLKLLTLCCGYRDRELDQWGMTLSPDTWQRWYDRCVGKRVYLINGDEADKKMYTQVQEKWTISCHIQKSTPRELRT